MPLVNPLSSRFASLPLILCGPIVRRTESDNVSVWVVLKEEREIALEVYSGYCTPSAKAFPEKIVSFTSQRTKTISLGDHLHIGLVTLQSMPAVEPEVLPTTVFFRPGEIVSYDLHFYKPGSVEIDENLISLGLLDEPELLGFKKGQLPSFIAAPEKLEDLRIAHGSCRKPHGRGRDGLAILAKVIEGDFTEPDRITNPVARPHIFFHTGDQIYADDSSDFLIQHYTDAGNFLMQRVEELPFPSDFRSDSEAQKELKIEDFVWMQQTPEAFAPGKRATNFYSGFTGAQGNHLFSLAEFFSAYMFQWCDVLWPPTLPEVNDIFKDRVIYHGQTLPYQFPFIELNEAENKRRGQTPEVPSNWSALPPTEKQILLTSAFTGEEIPGDTKPTDQSVLKLYYQRFLKSRQRKSPEAEQQERDRVEEFKGGLKAVRRVLANTPCIMSFDDHDVTDDWYLNGGWSKRALGSLLGERIIRNGLIAYSLFQAWGNDPKGWADKTPEKDARKKMLEEIPKLTNSFKKLQTPAPTDIISSTRPQGDQLFTDFFHEKLGFKNFEDPPVKWHCSLKLGPTQVYVLDTRTRRDFSRGLDYPPNLLGKKALAEQLPASLPFGAELAIVISGAPVLGLGTIESIGQPIVPKILDVKSFAKKSTSPEKESDRIAKRESNIKKGRDSLDVEHWTLHIEGYEALLKRCAGLKKVLFLSGDVHYGISSEMDYWVKDAPVAARFVQMVSSPLKNAKPDGQLWGIFPAAFTQTVLSGGLNREFTNLTSVGWEEVELEKLKLKVQTKPGEFADARPSHIPIRLQRIMSKAPVFLPLRDWPLEEIEPGNQNEEVKVFPRIVFRTDVPEPSFRWKLNLLKDERPDSVRFKSLLTKPPDLGADLVENAHTGDQFLDGLDSILRRASFFSRAHFSRTVNWYSHSAIVHFEKTDTGIVAKHSQYFTPFLDAPDDNAISKFDEPFFRHEVSLNAKAAAEKPPIPIES